MKLKKNLLLGAILVGLLTLISGTAILLFQNFNVIGQSDSEDFGIYYDFYVVGDYAYVIDVTVGFEVFDISDPITPVKVGEYPIYSVNDIDIYVLGSYVYVVGVADGSNHSNGFQIVDISDPTTPIKVAEILTETEWMQSVFVSGSYAYITGSSGGLKIFNISNPTTPSSVGQFSDGEWASDVFVVGDYAYLECFSQDSNGFDGLKIVDISNSTDPELIGQYAYVNTIYDYYERNYYVSGSYVYLTERNSDLLEIIDVSDPTDPVKIGQIGDCGGSNDIYVSGSYVYLALGSDGLKVIDISDPTIPVEIAHDDYNGYANGVYPVGGYVYVTDQNEGFVVIDPWNSREKTSSIILWSILGILILLSVVDFRYLLKKDLPLSKESKQQIEPIIEEEVIEVDMKEMSLEEEKKQKIGHFSIGFIIASFSIAIIIFLTYVKGSPIYMHNIESFLSIIPLGILISVFLASIINKKIYILMGIICAIFGLLFLKIKRNEDLFTEPYTEHPEKKKTHYRIGIFISIGLAILYSPLVFTGIAWIIWFSNPFDVLLSLLFGLIIFNNFNGVLKFFRREKLKFISKGMGPAFLIGNLLTIILSIIRWI